MEKLEAMGLLEKVEDYENKVGFSERAGVPIVPRNSMQWLDRKSVAEGQSVDRGGRRHIYTNT